MEREIINTETTDVEAKIIEAAKALFIEKGYAETCMSDIAAKAGINRPSLHYYFRTKDRLFQAVFGIIIEKILPRLHDIIVMTEVPITERIRSVVDTYYEVLKGTPTLPLFAVREIQRDSRHVFNAINESPMRSTFANLVNSLQKEMEEGKLNQVPLPVMLYTFYGLLTIPFLTKGLVECLMEDEGYTFDMLIRQWKPYIVRQMINLLEPKSDTKAQQMDSEKTRNEEN